MRTTAHQKKEIDMGNTRKELQIRLQEIQRSASELPDHEADIAQIHYQLTRLSSWTTRTIQFISTIEIKAEEKNEVQNGKLWGND
jgi:hypothetical protein